MSEILISPYLLSRVGGETFESVSSITRKSVGFIKRFRELSDARLYKDNLKLMVSNRLYNLIGELKDETASDRIKKIRRNLYNEKRVADTEMLFIEGYGTEDLKNQIDSYVRSIELISSITDKILIEYEIINESSKKELLYVLRRSTAVPKGLVLSSKVLLNDYLKLTKYAEKKIIEDPNTENGLLKYLTRSCCKTSPLSTFTNLGFSVVADSPGAINSIEGKNNVKSHIRLNSSILKYIKALLEKHQEIYPLIEVSLNPTIKDYHDHLKFLTNSNNKEAIQTINANAVLKLICEYLESSKIGVSYGRVFRYVLKITDAERKDVEHYIQMLFDVGFLEFSWPFSANDPEWSFQLLKKLRRYNKNSNGLLRDLIITLSKLNVACKKFALASAENRVLILNNAFNDFRECCKNLHILAKLPEQELIGFDDIPAHLRLKKRNGDVSVETIELVEEKEVKDKEIFIKSSNTFFPFKAEQIFYEDTVRDSKFNFNQAELSSILNEIDCFLNLTGEFELLRSAKTSAFDFYEQNYNRGQNSVPVLTFYEDYLKYLHTVKTDQGKLSSKSRIKSGKYKSPNDLWFKAFRDRVFKDNKLTINEKVVITNQIVKEVNNMMNIKTIPVKSSFAIFFQPFYRNGSLNIVVNEVAPGYGKFVSRFLHLLPQIVHDNIVDLNAVTTPEGAINAELSDSSYFNVNIHPPLTEYEIKSPGSNGIHKGVKKIPVSDISIRPNSKNSNLELIRNDTGQRVIPYDLCFQSLAGRSELFRLLDTFSDLIYQRFDPFTKSIMDVFRSKQKDKESILIIPRIYLGANVVISRKTWKIPVGLIPKRKKECTEQDYFIQVNNWRLENKIPDEVFITVKRKGEEVPFDINRVRPRSDHKPQYINFYNPLLVRVFEKEIRKVEKELSIFEMLPASEDMFKINHKRYVTEFVAQWYRNKE